MTERLRRLNGWKTIGAYFGRDRTTAVRWARERNLPVRKTPGGKLSSVYAFTDELDQWLSNNAPAGDVALKAAMLRDMSPIPASPKEEAETGARRPPARQWFARRFTLIALGVLSALALAIASLALYVGLGRSAPAVSVQGTLLPEDPQTATLYLQARRNWARRQSTSIEEAIRGFGAVISREPSYAPAYAGLADAYILAREFGSLPDRVAFPKAKAAATLGLTLDPDLVGSLRALAFVTYWWDHDVERAGRLFRQAARLDPADAQTHYWYGTALTDNGSFSAAKREFEIARVLNPESASLQADWAFLLWALDDRAAAMRILTGLIRETADYAPPYDSLRYIYIADGDFPRYLDTMSILAGLRGEASLKAQVAKERDALAKGGPAALKAVLTQHALEDHNHARGDVAWPAMIVSAVGDRGALRQILMEANRRNEKWGSAAQRIQIARAWRDDPEITRLLERLAPARME